MSDEVEGTHMGAGHDDTLAALTGVAEDRRCFVRHRHQLRQVWAREVLEPEQLTEVPSGHAENALSHRFELWTRCRWPHYLREICNNVFPVGGSRPNPDITRKIGDAVADRVRKPGSKAGNDIG
jgi:hypothetical protein